MPDYYIITFERKLKKFHGTLAPKWRQSPCEFNTDFENIRTRLVFPNLVEKYQRPSHPVSPCENVRKRKLPMWDVIVAIW